MLALSVRLVGSICCLSLAACVFDPLVATPQDFGNTPDRDGGVIDLGFPDSGAHDGGGDDAQASDGPALDATPDTGVDGGPLDANDTGIDTGIDTGVDTGTDTGIEDQGFLDTGVEDVGFVDTGFPDTGVVDVGPTDGGFPYLPSNTTAPGGGVVSWLIGNGDTCSFNTTSLTFLDISPSGCGNTPTPELRPQTTTGPEVVVLSVAAFQVDGLLEIRGGRPLIVLVYGDAVINRTIDVSAQTFTAGAGSDPAGLCGTSRDGTNNGEGGGGGGGVGLAGNGGDAMNVGMPSGNVLNVPLRGGCSGGRGDPFGQASNQGLGGGGGGAIQISASGTLSVGINASILAVGGGGTGGEVEGGAGGGGSGGAILLEGFDLISDGAFFLGGGGGGGGGSNNTDNATGTDGEDGNIVGFFAAAKGLGGAMGGDGGPGGYYDMALARHNAYNGRAGMGSGNPGSGGGGGAIGRVRFNGSNTCTVNGTSTGFISGTVNCGL